MTAAPATSIYESLRLHGVIPVLTVDRVADAAPLAAGGLQVAEVTFRTPTRPMCCK